MKKIISSVLLTTFIPSIVMAGPVPCFAPTPLNQTSFCMMEKAQGSPQELPSQLHIYPNDQASSSDYGFLESGCLDVGNDQSMQIMNIRTGDPSEQHNINNDCYSYVTRTVKGHPEIIAVYEDRTGSHVFDIDTGFNPKTADFDNKATDYRVYTYDSTSTRIPYAYVPTGANDLNDFQLLDVNGDELSKIGKSSTTNDPSTANWKWQVTLSTQLSKMGYDQAFVGVVTAYVIGAVDSANFSCRKAPITQVTVNDNSGSYWLTGVSGGIGAAVGGTICIGGAYLVYKYKPSWCSGIRRGFHLIQRDEESQ